MDPITSNGWFVTLQGTPKRGTSPNMGEVNNLLRQFQEDLGRIGFETTNIQLITGTVSTIEVPVHH